MEKGQHVEFSPTHISSIGPGKFKQIISNLKFKYLPWKAWIWAGLWHVALTQDDHQREELGFFSRPAEETFDLVLYY